MATWTRWRGVIAAVVAVGLAGCASAADPAVADPAAAGPFGTHHVHANAGAPAAEIAGTLVLTDGCLMVEPADFEKFPVALPDDATWNADDQAVTVGGTTYAVGDGVWWGGAYGPAARASGLPGTCPSGAEVGFVYSTS